MLDIKEKKQQSLGYATLMSQLCIKNKISIEGLIPMSGMKPINKSYVHSYIFGSRPNSASNPPILPRPRQHLISLFFHQAKCPSYPDAHHATMFAMIQKNMPILQENMRMQRYMMDDLIENIRSINVMQRH